MCQAYCSNCHGISKVSTELPITYKERACMFDLNSCKKANANFLCEPTFHSDPMEDPRQCDDCKRIERQLNPGHLVGISSSYPVHCPSRKPPSYDPPPYMAPPTDRNDLVLSVTRSTRKLMIPPMPQYALSPYVDGSAPHGNATAATNCTATQQQPPTPRSLHTFAANSSSNNRAVVITTTIERSNLLRPPPMPTFLESPYVCTNNRAVVITTTIERSSLLRPPPMPTFLESPYVCTRNIANNEQPPLQNLPPVPQTSNCRRLDNYHFDEMELTDEPRVLGLRSQWYINEPHESKNLSSWNLFSGWVRKVSEKMTGKGRSHQGTAQISRSKHLARQLRVKPQRAGISTWVASSANLDHEEQPVAWTY